MRLARAVRDFCDLVESAPPPDGAHLAGGLADALEGLLAAWEAVAPGIAGRLPPLDFAEDDDEPPSAVTWAEWEATYRRVGAALGPGTDDAYALAGGDLADDVADVWRELRDPLTALDAGRPLVRVVADWCLAMDAHAEEHARAALPELRRRVGGRDG